MFCSHFLSSFVKLGTLTIETANYQGKPLLGRKVTHLRRYIRVTFHSNTVSVQEHNGRHTAVIPRFIFY